MLGVKHILMKCAITVSSSRYIYVLYTKKKKKAKTFRETVRPEMKSKGRYQLYNRQNLTIQIE